MQSANRNRALPGSLVLLMPAATVITLLEGTPRHLPGVALGSADLLHVERGLTMFAAVVAILAVLAQAARGELPIELSASGLTDYLKTPAAPGTAASLRLTPDSVARIVPAMRAPSPGVILDFRSFQAPQEF